MKNKELFTGQKGKSIVKVFLGLQYWIAAVSYLIIFSLSILCLAVYLPDLSGADVLDTGTLTILKAMLILILIFATGAFGWEMLQWRKKRTKREEPSLEDIIKDMKKDTNGDSV
ncbi:MAG: hypothetical protein WC562_08280 [Dehalococcoidia bacterium]